MTIKLLGVRRGVALSFVSMRGIKRSGRFESHCHMGKMLSWRGPTAPRGTSGLCGLTITRDKYRLALLLLSFWLLLLLLLYGRYCILPVTVYTLQVPITLFNFNF